jgi:hypothetical protein
MFSRWLKKSCICLAVAGGLPVLVSPVFALLDTQKTSPDAKPAEKISPAVAMKKVSKMDARALAMVSKMNARTLGTVTKLSREGLLTKLSKNTQMIAAAKAPTSPAPKTNPNRKGQENKNKIKLVE